MMGYVPPIAPPRIARRIDVGPARIFLGSFGDAQAKCDYCGRYGALGQCEGCGAANVPTARSTVPVVKVPPFDVGWR